LAKLRDLHARGIRISSDPAFFHFGGGMAVRNLCRERLNDRDLAAYCFCGDWDMCYIGVLAGDRRDAGQNSGADRPAAAATPVQFHRARTLARQRRRGGHWAKRIGRTGGSAGSARRILGRFAM
jgi:hypothetical protein